uniref:Adhesion G protein-coupled receptor A1 n=1 Tax=Sarcophilus harrisii TaxID=9305 RepID=A0A7N4PPJ0_SARHA
MFGLFSELLALKVVHFGTDSLICDCHLRWVSEWARNASVRLAEETTCAFPTALRGRPLRGLQEDQLTCAGPLELPLFQLIPSQSQVVFHGDRLPFQCTATLVGNSTQAHWYHNGRLAETDEARGVFVKESVVHDCSLVTRELTLTSIGTDAAGSWECRVSNTYGNRTKGVEITVLETAAPYCSPERLWTRKGDFRWPRTLAGVTASHLCLPFPLSGLSLRSSPGEPRARRRCGPGGRWDEADLSECPSSQEVIQVLSAFATMHINVTNVGEFSARLALYTRGASPFAGKTEVVHLAQMMERLLAFVEESQELGDALVQIASNLMLVGDHALWAAQREDGACTRALRCLERVAERTPTASVPAMSKVSPNIALEAWVLQPSSFRGMSCVVFQKAPGEGDAHPEEALSLKCDASGAAWDRGAEQPAQVGITLHYSTLSTMLWIGVTARNIYKQVTKKAPQGPGGEQPPYPKQPLLRFYLISGGVPLIICGITAATNIKNYGPDSDGAPYCWMAWEPSLGAFYGPVAFIVLVTCIYFLGTYVQLRRHPERKYELKERREEPPRLAGPDAGPGPAGEPGPGPAPACSLLSASLLENEHSFKAQLRAAAFTLFLFLATWTFGALAVSQGPFLDMIFSCLYGAFCVTLGLFILIHHCAKRDDVWHCWWACCPARGDAYSAQAGARAQLDANGDAQLRAPCPQDSPCLGPAGAFGHAPGGRCKLTNLHAAQNHVACLSPVTPCCAKMHCEQLLEDEAHVHVHRPGAHLHRCPKGRAKPRYFSRHRAAAAADGEYAYHIPASLDGGSLPSSHTDSPRSVHEGPAGLHRACCGQGDPFPTISQPESSDASTVICSCAHLAEGEPGPHAAHFEMHPRTQVLPCNAAGHDGLPAGNLAEAIVYGSDCTGNIKTGPWRNETTV